MNDSGNTVRVNVVDIKSLAATLVEACDLLTATKTSLPPDVARDATLVAARGLVLAAMRRLGVMIETRGAIEPR